MAYDVSMELHYRQLGKTGPHVVILHGLFGSGRNWLGIARQLAGNCRVWLPDLRNHGDSFWSDDWNYPVMAADIFAFFQQQGIEQTILIGHSMGGKVAMLVATHYPERIQKLVVVDMAPRTYPFFHQDILRAMLHLSPAQISSRQQADEQLTPDIPDRRIRQFLLMNLMRQEHGFAWKMNLPVMASKIREVLRSLLDLVTQRPLFSGQSLFIRAENSGYITEKDVSEMSHLFPHSQFKTIANAGHWVHAEQPAIFLSVVREFIIRE